MVRTFVRGRAGFLVFIAYAALTLIMTWPLAAGLARDVPGDLGDSLLNMWILGWGAEHMPRVLTGQIAIRDYWNANIFHPEPLALGFSEHLFGEVLTILPVYWLTGNLILCYNLLFLSSFALSGFAMFLLVRDVLGSAPRAIWAAFVAGLIFAFIPLRIAQVAHIQSLQSFWMPLALLGLRRYLVSGRWQPLAAGAAALTMQHWSNGYYQLFFAPFLLAFVLHQMWTARRLSNVRTWIGLSGAAAVVALATWPFLALYLETQRVHGFERPLGEIMQFSADVYSYLTAPVALRLWGDVAQAFPKPEGELFFGVTPWALFLVATGALMIRPMLRGLSPSRWQLLLLAIVAIQTAGIVAIVFTGGFVTSIAGIPVRATNSFRLIVVLISASLLLAVVSPQLRERGRALARSPLTLFVAFAVVALWLSLGPAPQSRGRNLAGLGLYSALYDYVPGFAGLRVPARYAMLAAMFMAAAAGFGVERLLAGITGRRAQAWAPLVASMVAAIFIAEAWFAPMPINVTWGSSQAPAPARVYPRADAPAVYHQVANLRDDAVIAEFPFGDTTWEIRYVYYSTVHWRRLVNGYSGGFPQRYQQRAVLLQRVREDPEAAWQALKSAGTTHVVFHERAFRGDEARVVHQWLSDHFAVEIARFEDGDRLFDVSGVWPPR
jgi:hypothetical protein